MNVSSTGASGASGAPGGDDPHKPKGPGKKLGAFFSSLKPRKKDKDKKVGGTDTLPPRQSLLTTATPATSSSVSSVGADALNTSLSQLNIGSTQATSSVDKGKRTLKERLTGKKRELTPKAQYEALRDENYKLLATLRQPNPPRESFVKAAQQLDEICAMKPQELADLGSGLEAFKWSGLFARAATVGQYDLLLEWTRKFDNVETQCALLKSVGSGLNDRPSDAATRDFIDKLSNYYLEELPAKVLQSNNDTPGVFTRDELHQIMASFAGDLAAGAGETHAQQFFDKMPANLFEALDDMSPSLARRLFKGLDALRFTLGLTTKALVDAGSTPPLKPLTVEQTRRAEMILACEQLSHIKNGDNGVKLEARIGHWAMQGPQYAKAVHELAMQSPSSDPLAACRDAQSMTRWQLNLSSMQLDNLPEKFHTINYFQQMNLSNNNLEHVPMEMAQMEYFSGYTRRSPQDGRIEIDLTGNPLNKMTLQELNVLDDAASRPYGPIFKLPRIIQLADGSKFQSSQALVHVGSSTATPS